MTAGYVYIIGSEDGTGYFKVGRSCDVERRLKEIQAYSPLPLRAWNKIHFPDVEAAESLFHDMWASYRKHGEWFDLPLDAVHLFCLMAAQIESANQLLGQAWSQIRDLQGEVDSVRQEAGTLRAELQAEREVSDAHSCSQCETPDCPQCIAIMEESLRLEITE